MRRMSSSLPAAASAPPAKATSASAPSIPAPMWRKSPGDSSPSAGKQPPVGGRLPCRPGGIRRRCVHTESPHHRLGLVLKPVLHSSGHDHHVALPHPRPLLRDFRRHFALHHQQHLIAPWMIFLLVSTRL